MKCEIYDFYHQNRSPLEFGIILARSPDNFLQTSKQIRKVLIMSEKKLLDQLRDLIRTKHLSIRTEKTYVQWAKRFILWGLFL